LTARLNNYRWRLGLAAGEAQYDDLEKRLAQAPVISVPTITLEGDANGAPHPDLSDYARMFPGKYAHRLITGGNGHNRPRKLPVKAASSIGLRCGTELTTTSGILAAAPPWNSPDAKSSSTSARMAAINGAINSSWWRSTMSGKRVPSTNDKLQKLSCLGIAGDLLEGQDEQPTLVVGPPTSSRRRADRLDLDFKVKTT
jgi:hypothetical protein